MNQQTTIPEPISRNIFEQYYRLIESIRNEHLGDKNLSKRREEILESLGILEKIISAIERSIQDLTTDEDIDVDYAGEIASATVELLLGWVYTLAVGKHDPTLIKAEAYNFLAVLAIVEDFNNYGIANILRHLYKLSSRIEYLTLFDETGFNYVIRDMIEALGIKENVPAEGYEKLIALIRSSMKPSEKRSGYKSLDPFDIPSIFRQDFFELATPIIERLEKNYFRFGPLDNFQVLETQEIRKSLNSPEVFEFVEKLFAFDETKEYSIWNVKFTIEGVEQNATELGFMLWTFCSSIASLNDIEVILTEWGEGSKWFKLRIKIKSLAAKVDLNQLLKGTAQTLESVAYKKPIEEIQKYEAEANKLVAEKEKIEKETKNIMDERKANLMQDLEIQNKILELKKKVLEIEDKEADIRKKNLESIKTLSDLMANGIIQYNSEFQILINELIFFKKDKGTFAIGNVELLDMKEEIKPKDEEGPRI